MNDVSGFDLNLLKAFSAVYRHRNVTRAAQTIGLAQPSMSNALSRLRAALNDELFVKTSGGMVPTARAEVLAPHIEAAMTILGEVVAAPEPFNPKTSEAEITVAAPDNLVLELAPRLAARLATKAPNFNIRFAPLQKSNVFGELDSGTIDIAMSRFVDVPARFYQRDLASDQFVVIARRDHPAVAKGLTLDAFCDASHVLVSFKSDGHGEIDESLQKLGRQRRIALVLAQFGVVPDIIARTNYLATLPSSVADQLAERTGCSIHPLPLAQDDWTNSMIWSAQANADPAKRFAVSLIEGIQNRSSSTPKDAVRHQLE